MLRTALIVDDDIQIRSVVRNALASDFDRIVEASNGGEAINLVSAERPAIVVLDLGLPDTTGLAVCLAIRRQSAAPIVVLSARHADAEKVTLLDAGADDYVTKPFSTTELQARVRALLRRVDRGVTAAPSSVAFGDFVVDLEARTLTRAGTIVHLTPTEWELLRVLATGAGKVLTHQQLFAAVWSGRSHGDAQQYLRVYVANLRRKIEDDALRPRYIITEPGVGYRFYTGP